jgi:lipid-binding SYLF domain-containing protein
MRMKKILLPLLLLVITGFGLASDDRDKDKTVYRVEDSGTVLDEIMSAPDKGIPLEIMGAAECVAVVPSLKKGGFVIGAEYGKGVATCRNSNGWSAPAFFKVEGGSFGLQIGGQEVDLVMLIMNKRGMQALLSSHFKLGADASAAAGPVGRHVEGMTDWKMSAEVLTYSRAHGLFAGVTLNGAVIKQDHDDTRAFYGHDYPFRKILTGGLEVPADAKPFLDAVAKYNTPRLPEKTASALPASPAETTNASPVDANAAPATAKSDSAGTAKPSAEPEIKTEAPPDDKPQR